MCTVCVQLYSVLHWFAGRLARAKKQKKADRIETGGHFRQHYNLYYAHSARILGSNFDAIRAHQLNERRRSFVRSFVRFLFWFEKKLPARQFDIEKKQQHQPPPEIYENDRKKHKDIFFFSPLLRKSDAKSFQFKSKTTVSITLAEINENCLNIRSLFFAYSLVFFVLPCTIRGFVLLSLVLVLSVSILLLFYSVALYAYIVACGCVCVCVQGECNLYIRNGYSGNGSHRKQP